MKILLFKNDNFIQGFVCTPWLSGAQGNFLGDMSKWIRE